VNTQGKESPMKLLTRILLLAAAALAIAAVRHDDTPADAMPVAADPVAAWQTYGGQENFVPRNASWASVFGAGWH
jgi:hypothetical protein